MATYAIGDVQGCYDSLRALLDRLRFDPARDRLWFAGDLVNRGPRSLEVLRFVRALGDRAVVVLGNHDLYLLRRANGWSRRHRDSLDAVLEAPDRAGLVAWLRARPLLHREGEDLMVHAGLRPRWTVAQAERWAREAELWLRGEAWGDFLEAVFSQAPSAWAEAGHAARVRLAVDAFTRLRTLDRRGEPDHAYKGPPAGAPKGHRPWYRHSRALGDGARVIFGHWAAHGLSAGAAAICLDTGCVWGRHLTALRLEDDRIFQQPAVD